MVNSCVVFVGMRALNFHYEVFSALVSEILVFYCLFSGFFNGNGFVSFVWDL